jgi:hypothetical protein
MRQLTDHVIPKGNELNDLIRIEPGDEGVTSHKYNLYLRTPSGEWSKAGEMKFQKGPLKQIDPLTKAETPITPNGFSTEAYLTVILDHLRGFQNTDLSCRENSIVITHIESAIAFLQKRTMDRIKRGVEGTDKR